MLNSVLDGAKALLLDAVSILNESKIEYVVIGGWTPYLRNRRNDISHPGTKDIDILFKDANVQHLLHNVVKIFIQSGYLVSAKHDFQLFRIINVGGQELVYNIDLLHPSESKENPDLFVDHFEFDFCENPAFNGKKMVKSIVLPSSSVLFEGYFDQYDLTTQSITGDQMTGVFPLMNETGLILSKCQSVKSKKRERDAFDIFLVLLQDNSEDTLRSLLDICRKNEDIHLLIKDLFKYIKNSGHVFDLNVNKYCDSKTILSNISPSNFVSSKLQEIVEKKH